MASELYRSKASSGHAGMDVNEYSGPGADTTGSTRSAQPALSPSLAQLPRLRPLLYTTGTQAEICSFLGC